MFRPHFTFLLAGSIAAAIPALAQTGMPGSADAARIVAGNYKTDANHSQVLWTVNHLGVSPLSGAFPVSSGTLQLDPAKLSAAKVSVTFNVADISTTAPAFTKHLLSKDFFDVATFPTATFTSTAVQTSGMSAKVSGNLTIKGVTKPVTLDARFYGAGPNPANKKLNVGFTATTSIKRSDFGLGYALPMVGDQVDLRITGAFERVG